ncbi:MAG TPA: hypothetical protein VFY88_00385 [Intrasporangium sp.]|nr:hypothetical protein [Intrasporangium sp.]
MSAMPAAETNPAKPEECWCCGNTYGESSLLHLGSHPEVTVCLACGDYLARRAQERRDEFSPSLAGRARDVMRAGRRVVMDHGWHELPVVGRVLRWLDRYVP